MTGKAKCPDCGKKILWDWCHDIYVYPGGEMLKTETVSTPSKTIGEAFVCDCGTIIGITIHDEERGDFTYDHPDLTETDWEAQDNSYNPDHP